MLDGVINLISKTRTVDSYGRQAATETSREVFAQIESVSRAEFFAAGQNGLTPAYRFIVFTGEYQGERECEYNGVRYSIYRTYQPSAYVRHDNEKTYEGSISRNTNTANADRVELYASRKVGVNVVPNSENAGGEAEHGDNENTQ